MPIDATQHRSRIGLFVLYQGGVRVDLQRRDVTNSEMCRRGYSTMTAVLVVMTLLPLIRAVCVLAAMQGGLRHRLNSSSIGSHRQNNWHASQFNKI